MQTCTLRLEIDESVEGNKDRVSHVSLFRMKSEYRIRAAAGMTELQMDRRFAPALQDISLQLIIQGSPSCAFFLLPSSSFPSLCPASSSPSVPFISSSLPSFFILFRPPRFSQVGLKLATSWSLFCFMCKFSVHLLKLFSPFETAFYFDYFSWLQIQNNRFIRFTLKLLDCLMRASAATLFSANLWKMFSQHTT